MIYKCQFYLSLLSGIYFCNIHSSRILSLSKVRKVTSFSHNPRLTSRYRILARKLCPCHKIVIYERNVWETKRNKEAMVRVWLKEILNILVWHIKIKAQKSARFSQLYYLFAAPFPRQTVFLNLQTPVSQTWGSYCKK